MFIPVAAGLLDSSGKDIPLTFIYHDGILAPVATDGQEVFSTVLRVTKVKDIESITLEDAIELLQYPVTLGNHPEDDHPVLLRHSKSGFSIKHRRTVAPVPKCKALRNVPEG